MVFLKLFNMSISTGWLIIVVILFRLFLKKVPRWIICILWAIAAIRLICPFSFESSFSLIPSTETIKPDVVQYEQKPLINSGIPLINNTLNPIISESFVSDSSDSVNPLQIYIFIASIIWIIGLIILFSYALISFLIIRSKVRESILLKDNIWICDSVKYPFILGIIKPQIYLSLNLENDKIKYVLAHEQAHLKRREHWWKVLGYILLAIYWFNPLIWAAYILFCRDIELACDEKVIKHMNIHERKAYSETLLFCCMQKRMIMVYPLAFGEVNVKERIKMILNYRKPSFWIVAIASVISAVIVLCFLTNPKNNTSDIKIIIPANSDEGIYYSEEEISPKENKITLLSKKGLGDTEIALKPIEINEENAYDEPTYITPVMPVEMNAEKGAWFKVGINASNPTNEDIAIYVEVKGVEIRIADLNVEKSTYDDGKQENVAENTSYDYEKLKKAISAAILEKNHYDFYKYDFECCDFIALKISLESAASDSTANTVVCYGWALYERYNILEKGIEDVGGSHIPIALTFDINENGYVLKEYWQPRDGSFFGPDIRSKFPKDIAEDGMDSQKFIIQQIQSCYKQAVQFSGLDTDSVVSNLLNIVCSSPLVSSNPYDYINEHFIEYRELMYYREYTLRYCLNRFADGNETGLEGKIMAITCEELLQTKDKIPVNADTAETGQFWYNTLIAHASNKVKPYLEN